MFLISFLKQSKRRLCWVWRSPLKLRHFRIKMIHRHFLLAFLCCLALREHERCITLLNVGRATETHATHILLMLAVCTKFLCDSPNTVEVVCSTHVDTNQSTDKPTNQSPCDSYISLRTSAAPMLQTPRHAVSWFKSAA